MSLTVQAITAQHIGDRREQQDRVLIIPSERSPGTVLIVLADGAGGYKGGAAAAEQVIRTASTIFERYSPKAESAQSLLGEIVQEAHLIIRLNRQLTEEEPHSTIVAMLLQPNRVDWCFVGDSRLYCFNGAALRTRTRDHSFVEAQISAGQWKEEERNRHPNRSMLLQALGHSEIPKPEFGFVEPLGEGDGFLLCSDGLWETISDAELGQAVWALPPRKAAEILISAARARAQGRGDNISLAILKLVAN